MRLPAEGPGFQTIHASRSSFWGAPSTIAHIAALGAQARAAGLGDLVIEDISRPRGGPLPGGHLSHQLGLDVGNTASAIIPVKTGDPLVAAEATKLLLEAGVYANQIGYPAVSKKDARVRQSLMATHTQEDLDQVLNAWEWVNGKLKLSKKEEFAYDQKEAT